MRVMGVAQRAALVGSMVASSVALSACGLAPKKTLYEWGGYQKALYEHFKGDGVDAGAQIARLEAQVGMNEAAGKASPPGLHGHLALLYARAGDDANAARHLEAERRLFPESAAYIDLLLKNATSSPAARS